MTHPEPDKKQSATSPSHVDDEALLESETDMDDEIYLYMNEDEDFDIIPNEDAPSAGAPVSVPQPKTEKIKKKQKPKRPRPRITFNPPSRKSISLAMMTLPAVMAIAGMMQLPSVAKSHLEDKIHAAGFPEARVTAIDLGLSHLSATQIKLDQYGFDEIGSLHAEISWPSFLLSGDIESLSIHGIHIGRDSVNVLGDAKNIVQGMLELPPHRISVEDATIDITTDVGELRVTMSAAIGEKPVNGSRQINARIQSSQFQLGFDSTWQGSISTDGNIDLAGEIGDGRLNLGPMRVSRFNGWIGTTVTGNNYILQTQLEAGSASFMDVPLQNLALTGSYNAGKGAVIFRSGISGMPDITYTADIGIDAQNQFFQSHLSGKNLGNFLDYVEEVTGHSKTIRPALLGAGPFDFVMSFEPEKRFVGGPLPFSLSLETGGEKSVSGNILYYPDTFDMRGALETNMDMASAIQDYFKIPSEAMRQNFIRLDGDVRKFFAPVRVIPSESVEDDATNEGSPLGIQE